MPKKRSTKAAKHAPPRRRTPITWERVCRMARALPEVAESTSYGAPSLKVAGRHLASIKADGDTLVIHCGFLEREMLLGAQPDVFYLTDHYRDYAYVLVRLSAVGESQLTELLEDSWRLVAPKALVKAYDAR